MERRIGTVVRGVRTPIVKEGDDLVNIVVNSMIQAIESENIRVRNRDIVAITESLLARSQGNYATTDDIAQDVQDKFSGEAIGVVFPILSRNRFSSLLRGIAKSGKKLYILLSYPTDEVGNMLMDEEILFKKNINPYSDVLNEQEYRKQFGKEVCHPFTGIDYVKLYKEIAPNSEVILSNNPETILEYTDQILVSSIHTNKRVKRILENEGAKVVYGLDDILNQPRNDSGFNEEFGLLGSNLADENRVKLFPRDSQTFVEQVQAKLSEHFNKQIEVMVYGDGAFKDPAGKIWELADPVVSPGFTSGLAGTPREIKIKYIADTELSEAQGDEASQQIKQRIQRHREVQQDVDANEGIGTTPRQITDLLGSLADLTTGSGDKGTPIVYIQGYFDNYASE